MKIAVATNRRSTTNRLRGKRTNGIPGIGKLKELFSHREIWKRLLGTLVVIFIYRILAATPLPGIDVSKFQEVFGDASFSDTSYVFSLFTGGSFDSPSLVGMGIAAYINASIIIQLLTSIVPHFEYLSKEGQRGREILNRYTRWLTLPLAVFYAVGYVVFLRTVDETTDIGQQLLQTGIKQIFQNLTGGEVFLIVVTLTAGTMLLMWLAEVLSEVGIGNGMSIFISMNIATTLPALLARDFAALNIPGTVSRFFSEGDFTLLTSTAFIYLYLIILGALLIFAAIVFTTESVRKVTIQYARRTKGVEGEQTSYLPLKLNQSGVIPVIFASSLLTMPQIIIPLLVNFATNLPDGAPLKNVIIGLNNSFLFSSASAEYILFYVFLIIVFSFFYAFVVMQPSDIAENLQKSGGFIPGIRPGKSTADYIIRIMLRLTFVGALFLAAVAVLPLIVGNSLVPDTGLKLAVFSGVGGTSIIIIVGTALETYRQMRAMVVSKSYENYV